MEKLDQPARTESKAQLVEQVNACLRSGEFSRAADLLRRNAGEFSNDADLSKLEKLAHDGIKAEADRLITESQELFAQQKSAEAIQLLRKAYELDKKNALARTILANALVEHAQSIVETDWLEAEKLTNQALGLNPAHPTAKAILSRIVEQKEKSSVEDWVSQARKLQSSGDLFGALAWVAEGLAVHPHDAKLLQIQDAIQRDQDARRRQARRGDLEDLRRMQKEIDGATDIAAKQGLAARIQGVAAKHWTDGEILSIANALLLRLGLVSQDSSKTSPRNKGAAVILHVPRPTAPEAPRPATSPVALSAGAPNPLPPKPGLPSEAQPTAVPAPTKSPAPVVAPSKVPASAVTPVDAPPASPEPQVATAKTVSVPTPQISVPAPGMSAPVPKVTERSRPKQPPKSKSALLVFVSLAAMVLVAVAGTFFFTRRHYATSGAKTSEPGPALPTPAASPEASAPNVAAPAQTTPEPSVPAPAASSDTPAENFIPDDQPPSQPGREVGTLEIIAGQDDAKVFLNGKLQRQHTQGGQLRLPNLAPKDYVVQVSKAGFQDPPQQKIRVRTSEEAQIRFELKPQPSLASLTIQGCAPGTSIFVDQALVGTVQADGTLSVATVTPGDHTVELRKDRFKSRQLKKHFTVGAVTSLAGADVALEAAPGQLKITFTPADSRVALVKGDLLKTVSSGVPLELAAGTYTLTARTADGFVSSATLDVTAGQSRTLELSFAPNGMSKWQDAGAWKHEGDSFVRKGGDFVLYGVAPVSGTFAFSAMPIKGHALQWVLNYTDSKNYVLFQMDDKNFYRSVMHNGEKSDEIIVPYKGDKKSFHAVHVRVSPGEIIHQVKEGDRWRVLDRWTQTGANLSVGKFGFYLPGNDEVALSGFSHYADLNIR